MIPFASNVHTKGEKMKKKTLSVGAGKHQLNATYPPL